MNNIKAIFIICFFLILMLSACTNKQLNPGFGEQISAIECQHDNKICPSGDIVGRIPPDCSFAQCPKADDGFCDYGSPKRDYKGKSDRECQRIKFQCTEGVMFSDKCGCGCTVDYTPPDLSNSKVTNN